MEESQIQMERLDPETEFLLSKRQTGNEWELFKENVRPLKRGRKVELLNDALKSHNDNQLKKSLLENRRFIFFQPGLVFFVKFFNQSL
jgi:checkpoint serine/threonine-protein kinase